MSSESWKDKILGQNEINEADLPEDWTESAASGKEVLPSGEISTWGKIGRLRAPWVKVSATSKSGSSFETTPQLWPIEKIRLNATAFFALVQEAKTFMAHRILKTQVKNGQYGIYDYVGCSRHAFVKGQWTNTKQSCPFCEILSQSPDKPPKRLQALGVVEVSATDYVCPTTKVKFPVGVPHVMFIDDTMVFTEILHAITTAKHENKDWRGLIFKAQRSDQKISPRLGIWRFVERSIFPVTLDKEGWINFKDPDSKEAPIKVYKIIDFNSVLPCFNGKNDYNGAFPVADHLKINKELIDKHLILSKKFSTTEVKFNAVAYKNYFGCDFAGLSDDVEEDTGAKLQNTFNTFDGAVMEEQQIPVNVEYEQKPLFKIEGETLPFEKPVKQEEKVETKVDSKPLINPITGKELPKPTAGKMDNLKEESLKFTSFDTYANKFENELGLLSSTELDELYTYWVSHQNSKPKKTTKSSKFLE